MAYKRYQLPGPMPGQSYFIADTAAEAITGPAAGDIKYALDDDVFYTYDGAVWNPVGTGGGSDGSDHNILDHADTSGSPAPGDVLTYDGADWAPDAPAGGTPKDIVWLFATKVHPETGIGRAMFAPYDATIVGAYAWCTDSLPTSTMTADVLLNSVTIGGTKPTVTSGNDVGAIVNDMTSTAVVQLDKLEVEIEATGGSDGRIFVAVLIQQA